MYALRVSSVNKTFKELFKKEFKSVKDVSFDVERGTIFGVLGPNGCGKSTLIRMISTLLLPDSGKIRIFGKDVLDPSVKEVIGRVSVDASFFMKLNAIENLDYAAGLYGLDRKTAQKKALEILAELGLPEEKIKLPLEKLSRGQQQKIAITRGFLADPKLVLLDEPTTGLDPVSKLDVQKFINKMIAEKDVTIVITSHDMEEINKLCNEMVIMNEGEIIARGTANDLKAKYVVDGLYALHTSIDAKEIVKSLNIETVSEREDVLDVLLPDIDKQASQLIQELQKQGVGFVSLTKVIPTLEDVFVKLTGKQLE